MKRTEPMMKMTAAGIVGVLLGGATLLHAEDMPPMPKPTKQHEWLQRFVGKWDSTVNMMMEPGKPPMKGKATETFRSLGRFWVVSEGRGQMMGQQFLNSLTLGYDPGIKKYVGTWVDSENSYLWKYTGALDATGNTLTLLTQGPCPMKGGKIVQFKEVTVFKSPNHRVFTSSMKSDDGKWVTMMTMDSRRSK